MYGFRRLLLHTSVALYSIFWSKYHLPLPEADVKQVFLLSVHQVNYVSIVASSVRKTMPRPSFQSLILRPRAAEKGSNNNFFKEPHKSQKKGMQCALDEASGLCKGRKGPFTQLWIDSSFLRTHSHTNTTHHSTCAVPALTLTVH